MDVVREGADVLVLTAGPGADCARRPRPQLAGAKGIEATVAGVRRVHPLDSEALAGLLGRPSARWSRWRTTRWPAGSARPSSSSCRTEGSVLVRSRSLGLPDAFVCQGSLELLRRDVGLTAQTIADAVERLVAAWYGRSGGSPESGSWPRTPRMRLDELVLSRGLAASRTAARGLIMAGLVLVDGQVSDKAGTPVAIDGRP